MRKLSSVTTAVLVLVLLSGGATSGALGAESILNPKCPVLTDEASDPNISTMYQGKKVLFCCPKCRTQFLQKPDAYLKNLPQFADAVPVAVTSDKDAPAPASHPTPKLLSFLGRFHPAVVHFPIALILGALLAEILSMLTARGLFAQAARVMIVLGALGAVVAAGLGWMASLDARYPAAMMEVLEDHESAGITTAVLAVMVAGCSELSRRDGARPWKTWLYRALLLGAAVGVAITGYFGGILVYGPDPFKW